MSDDRLALYREMVLIRRFEERLLALFRQGELRGTAHVCIGQEAVAVGVCAALTPSDRVLSTHRGHGHLLARGADPKRLMAEMFGRSDGYALGRGGSQHVAAFDVGFLGSNGITGGGLPIAVGAALAQRLRRDAAVTVAFYGDGAAAQGAFHEAVNLAAVWRLPVLFLCENNQYAMGTSHAQTCPVPRQSDRAAGYGLRGVTCDGNDVEAVREAVREARARLAAGGPPELIEALTYRREGHSRSDPAAYRAAAELDAWRAKDPIERLRRSLTQDALGGGGSAPGSAAAVASALDAIDAAALAAVDDAVAFARHSPPLPPEDAERFVTPEPTPTPPPSPSKSGRRPTLAAMAAELTMTLGINAATGEIATPDGMVPSPKMTYARALYAALGRALGDPQVVLLGEDIADYRGAFRVTDDLYERFGRDRVRNTPISENGIVGAGIGLALEGFRPVVEIMFMDFLLLAFDQLVNHAAKFPWIHGGRPLPLVVRTPAGGRRGYGPTHSQCFESLLLSVPGLRIFTPATPQDAYDLLLDAIFGDAPTVVVEHKLLYGRSGPFDPAATPLPPGKARVVRSGTDVTIVTFSEMVERATAAAERLAGEGVSAEVIDLRTLAPLDFATVAASAARTQRVVVAEEGVRTGGVGAELAARLQEECFGSLDAPIVRVGARSCPQPTNAEMEHAALPWEEDIVAAVRSVL